ncbi:hypothetical protein ACC759_39010, partial [Rhizobium ruizarguesonis]
LGDDDISSLPRAALARRVAFVEQQSTTDTQFTVRDVVRLGRTPHRGLLSSSGAGPTRKRAAWGMTRPTKPIEPTML